MLQQRHIFIRIEKIVLTVIICTFTIFLISFSTSNLSAAKNGLFLWSMSVVPTLLPFFIAAELLSYTNIINIFSKLLNGLMRPIFHVPGEGAFAFVMGIISGYPIGAQIVSNLKTQGICTNIECERLISFTNNSGPLFIIGTVGISLFSSQKIGFQLLIVHIISCLLVGFLFRFWKYKDFKTIKTSNYLGKNRAKKINPQKDINIDNLGEILSTSIQKSIQSVLLIGGFVVFFSVVVSMLESSKILGVLSNLITPVLDFFNVPGEFANSIIVGLIEVTNGVKSAAFNNSKTAIILCSFLLGFGGISVLFQVFSITSKAKISIKPYLIGKLLQAIISAILMSFILYF